MNFEDIGYIEEIEIQESEKLTEEEVENIIANIKGVNGVINRLRKITIMRGTSQKKLREFMGWTNDREWSKRTTINKSIDVLASYNRKIRTVYYNEEKGIEEEYVVVNEMERAMSISGVSKGFLLGYTDNPLEAIPDSSIIESIGNMPLKRNQIKAYRNFYGVTCSDVTNVILSDLPNMRIPKYKKYEAPGGEMPDKIFEIFIKGLENFRDPELEDKIEESID